MIWLTLWLYGTIVLGAVHKYGEIEPLFQRAAIVHSTLLSIKRSQKAFQTLIKSQNFLFQVSKFYYPGCVDGESEEWRG